MVPSNWKDEEQSPGQTSSSAGMPGTIMEMENSAAESVSDDSSTTSEDQVPDSSSEETKIKTQIAAREAKYVLMSKLLVVIVLIGCATAASIIAYRFTTEQEETDFQNQFRSYAAELIEVSSNTAFNTFSVLESLSKTVTSLAIYGKVEWPLITIPHFEVRGSEYLASSGAQLVAFAPIVTDERRDFWEPYSTENQDWIQDGLDYLAEEGVTNLPPTAEPIRPEIWRHALRSNKPVREYGQAPWVPLWQTFPPPTDAFIVNYSLLSHPSFEKLINIVWESRKAVLSEVLDNTVLFGNAKTTDTNPKSVVVQPVFKDFTKDSEIMAFLVVIVPWDNYFQHVIYTDSHPIMAVLSNNCGDAFTYRIDGPDAEFLGEGDLHDDAFDELEVSTSFAEYVERSVGVGGGNTTSQTGIHRIGVESYCDYSLHVYPTQQMRDEHDTSMPLYITVGVIGVFAFTSLVFILYDTLVTARQRKVANQANRTTALVTSLFPTEVHDRLFGLAEQEANDNKKQTSHAPKFHLMNFLSDEESKTEHGTQASRGKDGTTSFGGSTSSSSSKPIADLFPDATIMFADINGFTAWSSVREPSQVFILLETLYNAFDRIAKKRKVFKVETIGDTYLAVCGLPTPRKDHAVVMARFAYDCNVECQRLCNDLEVELGPDTSDLAMRFGLHSGPVTAGVLRGEKTRFQLFGDTVNTASRMESTSERHKIQASFDTAALLREAGKGKWLTPREQLVFAKGKGEMQTYFVNPKSAATRSLASSGSGDSQGGDSAGLNESSNRIRHEEIRNDSTGKLLDPKLQRSADWICEILLRLLKQMVARRRACGQHTTGCSKALRQQALAMQPEIGKQILDEVQEVIYLPKFDAKAAKKHYAVDSIVLPPKVKAQLHDFVGVIAAMYRDNPFHSFHHAAHVTMSVSKLLSRIVAPDLLGEANELECKLHDHTYGITSDPLTQFAVVFSAMIHDVDHSGLPNATLVRDKTDLAEYYRNKSIAEQNSVDLTWSLLMDGSYKDLCACIFTNEDELKRFRQLVVNTVMATDIADKELAADRRERWAKAFAPEDSTDGSHDQLTEQDVVNRKATIVLEHIIQASDVSHTMQHWQIYVRWNEKLFAEMHRAYRSGLSDTNPALFWYQGELGFYDFYIIPLAKKLKECGVFGVSSAEYLTYAMDNRKEWEKKGKEIVEGYIQKYDKSADA